MSPRIRAEIQFICALHSVSEEDLRGPLRRRHLDAARRQCWALLRTLRNSQGQRFSYPQIGRWFGRDHTTILLGERAYFERLAEAARAA